MVKELRERTQAGMGDCKAALVEAGGDIEKAIEVILKKGIVKAASRAGKVAAEGAVRTALSADKRRGVIVEVNCQTDFVAIGEDFKGLVSKVIEAAQNAKAGADLNAEKAGDKTIDELRQSFIAKSGENVVVRRWAALDAKEPGGLLHEYIHMGGKLAVLIHAEAPTAEAAKSKEVLEFIENVAMQIAAMNPLVVSRDQVDAASVEKQKEIFTAQLKEENVQFESDAKQLEEEAAAVARGEKPDGDKTPDAAWFASQISGLRKKQKPEASFPKIIEGKVNKWLSEASLLGQENVWNPADGSIDKIRGEISKKVGGDLKFHGFVRFGLGEGIEKKTDNLADEVAKLM